MLHLVAASDSRFFPGLLTALSTAVGCASGRYRYRVTVIDSGLSAAEWYSLESHLGRIAESRGIGLDLRRMGAASILARFPERRGSSLTYARLAIPHLLDDEFLVYLDSDVVCLRGVEEFWESLDTTVALSAARDPLGYLVKDCSARKSLPPHEWSAPYFNAGVIGINAEMWRRGNLAAKMDEMIRRVKSLTYADQSLLNVLFRRQWAEVSPSANQVLTLRHCAGIPELAEPANFHYVGTRKPWLSSLSSAYRMVPDRLFDLAHAWATGEDTTAERQLKPASLEKTRRKAALYRFLHPGKSEVHLKTLRNVGEGARIAAHLWRRFGMDSLRSPAPAEARAAAAAG